jgi:hypothetical protein
MLKEYGELEKLTQQGTYYIPLAPDKATYRSVDPAIDNNRTNKGTYMERFEGIQKKVSTIEDDRLKLFTLITMYMSEECVDTIKEERGWIQ